MADTPVSPTSVDSLPTTPNRFTQTPAQFEIAALAWSTALGPFTTQMNALGTNVKFNADSAFESGQTAYSSSQAATAAANFVGDWDDQTGAATAGISVRHVNRIWRLLNNLADITASEPGITADWAAIGTLATEERTSNTPIDAGDVGKILQYTGTFTQTFSSASAVGSGFFVYLQNVGTGAITLDPSGSETIDGLTSFVMYPGEARLIKLNADEDAFESIVLNAFSVTFTASGSFITPPGYNAIKSILWGGGGGGNATGTPASGGGGACVAADIPHGDFGTSETIAVGAGGAVNTAGGNSSIGSLITAYGGGGGADGASGSGGGALSAGGASASPGRPLSDNNDNAGYGGGVGGGATGGSTAWGGAGGGTDGGSSVWGGAGGGNVAGTSVFGGNGGANGENGVAPGGGGGQGSTSGARGEVRLQGLL